MTAPVALLTLCLLQQPTPQQPTPQQDPAQQDPAPIEVSAGVDVIELEQGGRLEGSIVEETKDYVQIRLAPGTVVGFERSKISRITRSSGKRVLKSTRAVLDSRDEWFVLHDAEGRIVGRLHSTVTADDDGRIRLGEEWEFTGKRSKTGITRLEVVTSDLEPVSSFYHERRVRLDGRTLKERLVRGTIDGENLVVEKQTNLERDRKVYPLDSSMRFPMAVLESLRQKAGHRLAVSYQVFDPGTEEFSRRNFTSGQSRTVEWRNESLDVHEVCYDNYQRRNTEWVDASSRTIRREINGSSLVAVPITPEMSESYLTSRDPVFPPAVAIEPQSRFALWLPNPSWRLKEIDEAGQVTAENTIEGASASMVAFDHLDGDLLLESVADTVTRWMTVAKHGVEIVGRELVSVRKRDAVRIDAVYSDRRRGRREAYRCEVFVFSVDGRHMALCFDAPRRSFDRLQADFGRVLETVELYPRTLDSGLVAVDR